MNLAVEWVSQHSLYKEPWKDLQEIPVIRVATLRGWLEKSGDGCITLEHLLAQLPEEGV